MLSTPEIASIVAAVCIFRAYAITPDGHPSEDLLGRLEMIARFLHAILEFLGTSPHLGFLSTLWQMVVRSLAVLETEAFPNEPMQTPLQLTLPTRPKPLSALAKPEWEYARQYILPGWRAITHLRRWVHTHYDREMHLDIFRILEDSLLLIESVAFICNTELQPEEEELEEY